MVATWGTGPTGESTNALTKGNILYPARSCAPARGSVLGPQQTPVSTSGGGTSDSEEGVFGSSFERLVRGWKDWVMVVFVPVESIKNSSRYPGRQKLDKEIAVILHLTDPIIEQADNLRQFFILNGQLQIGLGIIDGK